MAKPERSETDRITALESAVQWLGKRDAERLTLTSIESGAEFASQLPSEQGPIEDGLQVTKISRTTRTASLERSRKLAATADFTFSRAGAFDAYDLHLEFNRDDVEIDDGGAFRGRHWPSKTEVTLYNGKVPGVPPVSSTTIKVSYPKGGDLVNVVLGWYWTRKDGSEIPNHLWEGWPKVPDGAPAGD